MKDDGVISVIMRSFNHERYIGKAIESVLGQTYRRWELVIFDDCSSDDSLAIARSYSDNRITVIASRENQGASRAYAEAYSHCRGDYITSVDSDDYIAPAKFEEQISFLENHPDIDICGTHVFEVDRNGSIREEQEIGWFNKDLDLNDPANWIFSNRLCHSSVILRKSLHDSVGMPNRELIYSPDYELWLRFFVHGARFHVLPDKLTYYRVHEKRITGKDPERLFWEYVYLSTKHLHPYLHGIDRQDLIVRNVKAILNNTVYEKIPFPYRAKVFEILFGTKRSYASLRDVYKALDKPDRTYEPITLMLGEALHDANRYYKESQRAWQTHEETNARLAEAQARLAQIDGEKTKYYEEAREAWRKYEDANNSLVNAQDMLAKSDGEKTKYYEEAREAWRKYEDANNSLVNAQDMLAKSDGERKKYYEESRKAWQKHEETNARLKEAQARISETEDQKAKYRAESQEAWSQLRISGERLAESESHLSSAKARIAGMEAALSDQEALLAVEKSARMEAEKTLQDTEAGLIAETAARFGVERRLHDIEARLADSEARRTHIESKWTETERYWIEKDIVIHGLLNSKVWKLARRIITVADHLLPPGTRRRVLVKRTMDQIPILYSRLTKKGNMHAAAGDVIHVKNDKWEQGKPLVSLILCMDDARIVMEKMECLSSQTFLNMEIIVSGHAPDAAIPSGKTDENRFSKIVLLDEKDRHEKLSANDIVALAKGKYICFIHEGDKLAPTYIEKCIVKMEYENLDVCYSDIRKPGEMAEIVNTGDYGPENLMHSEAAALSPVIRKEAWRRSGGYDGPGSSGYEGWSVMLNLSREGAAGGKLKEALVTSRRALPAVYPGSPGAVEKGCGEASPTATGGKAAAKSPNVRYVVERRNINLTAK